MARADEYMWFCFEQGFEYQAVGVEHPADNLAVSRGKVQDAQFAFHMGDVFDDLVRLFFANGEVVAC